MGRPAILADDLVNTRLYPNHVLDAEEEPAGFEAFRCQNGRRSELDYAAAATANSDWWLRSVFDRVRAFDYMAIDWNTNLLGRAIKLQCTFDATDFLGTYVTPLNLTLPAV